MCVVNPSPVAKVSELRGKKPQQSFEEAITAGDAALPKKSVARQQEETADVLNIPSPGMEEPLSESCCVCVRACVRACAQICVCVCLRMYVLLRALDSYPCGQIGVCVCTGEA